MPPWLSSALCWALCISSLSRGIKKKGIFPSQIFPKDSVEICVDATNNSILMDLVGKFLKSESGVCLFCFYFLNYASVQFSSVAQSCPTLCNPMDWGMPGLRVHLQLLEFTQTHVHWVGDVIQLSHPLSSPSPALNLSQHQGLFKWVNSSHQVAKVLKFQLQHQSLQWTPRTDLL